MRLEGELGLAKRSLARRASSNETDAPDETGLPSVRVTAFGPDDLLEGIEPDLASIGELRQRIKSVWIDMVGSANTRFISLVCEQFGLHEPAL